MEQQIGRYWTKEGDEKLIQIVNTHGKGKWKIVAKKLGLGKSGSSCSQRYNDHLRPGLVRGPFSEEEKLKIRTLHSQFRNKWAKIAGHLTGRTANAVKNFCNTHLAKEKKKAAAVVPPPPPPGGGGVIGESSSRPPYGASPDGGITVPAESGHFDVFPLEDGGFTFPESDHGGGVHPSPPVGGVTFPESGGVYPSQPPFPIPDGGVGGIAFPKSGLSYDHQLGVYPSQPPFPLPDGGVGGVTFPEPNPLDVSYGGGVHRVYPSPPRSPLPYGGGVGFPETDLSWGSYGGGTDGVYPSPPPPPCVGGISSFGDVCYDHQLGNNGGTFGNPTIGAFMTPPPWDHNRF